MTCCFERLGITDHGNETCCPSCIEDMATGYEVSEVELPTGEVLNVCCSVSRFLESKEKTP